MSSTQLFKATSACPSELGETWEADLPGLWEVLLEQVETADAPDEAAFQGDARPYIPLSQRL